MRLGGLGLGQASEGLAGTSAFPILAIGSKVKQDEKDEVGAQHADAGEGGKLLPCAVTAIGHPREVHCCEMRIGGEVDEPQVDDELDDLQAGDPLLPPNSDAAGALEVVPVHNDMDRKVQSDGDPRHGGVADQLGVTKNSSGAMVIAVEEG